MPKSPDAFRTISEVADWLGIQAHVLRFWESKFTQVKPIKRAGGRRYYRPVDMQLLGGIKRLLHDDGLTIKGVQKILREEGMSHVAALSGPLDDADGEATIEARPTPAPQPEPQPEAVVLPFEAPKDPAEDASATQAEDATVQETLQPEDQPTIAASSSDPEEPAIQDESQPEEDSGAIAEPVPQDMAAPEPVAPPADTAPEATETAASLSEQDDPLPMAQDSTASPQEPTPQADVSSKDEPAAEPETAAVDNPQPEAPTTATPEIAEATEISLEDAPSEEPVSDVPEVQLTANAAEEDNATKTQQDAIEAQPEPDDEAPVETSASEESPQIETEAATKPVEENSTLDMFADEIPQQNETPSDAEKAPEQQEPLQGPESDDASEESAQQTAEPSPAVEEEAQESPQAPEEVAAKPKPRDIGMPFVASESDIPADVATLTHAHRVTALDAETAEKMKPLLAQLSALRDRMAAQRGGGQAKF